MDATERMNGAQKAALFLMVMGEEFTAKVFNYLAEKEIKTVGENMAKMRAVDSKAISTVIEEFIQQMRGTALIVSSGENFFERTVTKAFDPNKAQDLLRNMASGSRGSYFEKLRSLSPETLSNFIANEHPQTIALILSNLNVQTAGAVISRLPEDVQSEVIVRIARLDAVPDEIMREIQTVLEEQVSTVGSAVQKPLGGIMVAAEILNQVDRKMEKAILDKIEEDQEELADEIRQSMFVFEDLMTLDDRSIRALLKEISNDELILALKTASEALREKIFGNLSKRASEMLKEDIEVMGPVKLRDVEQAQQYIIKTARRLEEEGKVVLGGKGGEEVVV